MSMANQMQANLEMTQLSSPIDRLPADILCKIFPLVIELELESSKKNVFFILHGKNNKSKEIQILLSHVCKKWRNVVLDYALFWTRIETARFSTEKIYTYLSRSRESPLNIVMDFGDRHGHTTPNVVDMIQRHTQRIQKWHVFADYSEAIIQSRFCMLSTPNLKTLSLDLHCDYTLPRDTYVVSQSQVFPEYLPSLRKLTLIHHGTKVLKNSWLIHLTSLTIRDTGNDMTLSRLLDILGLCYRLEILQLSNIHCLVDFDVTVIKTAIVSLPRLHQFQMSLREDECSIILASLQLPENVSWKISCETIRASDFAIQNLPIVREREVLQISLGGKEIDIIAHPRASFKCFSPARADSWYDVYTERDCKRISRVIPFVFPDTSTLRFSFQDYTKRFVALQDWIAMVRGLEGLRTLEFRIDFLGDKPYEIEMDILTMLKSLLNDFEIGAHTQFRTVKFLRFPFDDQAACFIDVLYDTLNNCANLPDDFELHIQRGRDLTDSTIEKLLSVVKVSVSDLNVVAEQEWYALPPSQYFLKQSGHMLYF